MCTRETVVHFGNYKVSFRVFDDESWLVTIDNIEDELGATGCECKGNWNKGLASAFVNYAEMISNNQAQDLMYELVMNENIDNEFTKYLPQPYSSSCSGCPFQKDGNSTPSVCMGG